VVGRDFTSLEEIDGQALLRTQKDSTDEARLSILYLA